MEIRALVEETPPLILDRLSKGTLYKRLIPSSYSEEDQLSFGVVSDIFSNGTDSGFIAVEYLMSYASPKITLKFFASSRDLKIFPASKEEFMIHLDSMIEAADSAVKNATNTLDQALTVQERLNGVMLSFGDVREQTPSEAEAAERSARVREAVPDAAPHSKMWSALESGYGPASQ